MKNGIIVAREGYSVEKATILQQVFNSNLTTLKTIRRVSGTSTASGNRTIILDTNSYRSGFLAWFEVSDSGNWFPVGSVEHLSGANCSVNCYVNNSFVLYADIYSASSIKIDIKLYLLSDPGS